MIITKHAYKDDKVEYLYTKHTEVFECVNSNIEYDIIDVVDIYVNKEYRVCC